MKFSICIPNYNYERYLGETIRSVLTQEGVELEVLVADNCSTDRSLEVVRGFADERVQVRVNTCNVGFARNLDKAAAMASGDVMIMLSSDDLMLPGALTTYRNFFLSLGADTERSVVTATADVIDPEGKTTGRMGPDPLLWHTADRWRSESNGTTVYRVAAPELLRRCLTTMRNPFNFLATAYPSHLYRRVEGYGGGRLISPDKWFHWRLLSIAKWAFFVDRPLFAYRWHPANQTAQQAATGALKHAADDYANVLEVDGEMLQRAGLERADVEKAFVEYSIARHGLATLARGQRARAARICSFGAAVYPSYRKVNAKATVLRALVLMGPLGTLIARLAYKARLAAELQGR